MKKLKNELRETDIKIQKGESVNNDDLNRLWNYRNNQINKLKLCVYWSNGFKYKMCWFNWRVLEWSV